jgi:hypothetical protein
MVDTVAEENEEKQQNVLNYIADSDMPEEAKKVGIAKAAMGAEPDAIIGSMANMLSALSTREAEAKTPPQKGFKGYSPIERQIAKMLTESTGADILDSGGAYGRNWQRNREVEDFRKLPEVNIEIDEERVPEEERTMVIPEKQKSLQKTYLSTPVMKKAPALKVKEEKEITNQAVPSYVSDIRLTDAVKKKRIKA